MRKDWEIKTLKEVCAKITDGTHQTPKYFDNGFVFLSSKNVTSGKIDWDNIKYIDEKQHLEMHKRVAPRVGDILLAKNGTTGVAAMVDRDVVFDIYVSLAHIRVLDEVTPEFMLYFINSPVAKNQFNKRLKGSGVPNLHLEEIREVKIPFPKSLPEQKRIVSILDRAFAAIAKAKANAEQNLNNAKALFESYLQGVFENGNWKKKVLREITTILGDGLHGTPKYTVDGDYYFINGNNLNDGRIEFKESTKRINVDEFNKHKKNLTDRTVFVSINGTLGNVAFYNGEKIILGKSACYFNLKENVDKGFVKYVLSSPYFINYAHREATGATIKNVSLKSMREFKVPLPTIQEQQTIVHQLDALRAETQKLEVIYQKKLEDLEELKKSILQKAFNGEM